MIHYRFTGSGGVTIAADVAGDSGRPAVILLHGGGQTRHSWGSARRELVRFGYHVIAMDLRGHGESDWAPDKDYSLDAFKADLLAVIATLPNPPALVGASLGGLTALVTIGESEEQVASALVLVDVVPTLEEAGKRRVLEFMTGFPRGFADLEEAARAIEAYTSNRKRRKNPEGLKKNLRLRSDGRWYWHWDPDLLLGKRGPGRSSPRLHDAARRVNVPTLLVRGVRSDVVTAQGARELLKLIPGAELAEVEDAGHMIAGDWNDAFNAAVETFLRRVVRVPHATITSREVATPTEEET